MENTIVDEWTAVEVPPPPQLKPVVIDPKATALLILDIQTQNCKLESRPRCVASIPNIKRLLGEARSRGIPVVYSLTPRANVSDIIKDVAPREGDSVVKSGVGKFNGTNLAEISRERGLKTVIVVGTSAHGAVLHTAAGAALRQFRVIVPVDGMSAGEPYAEQYSAWHLANAPGSRRQVTLTRTDLIPFSE